MPVRRRAPRQVRRLQRKPRARAARKAPLMRSVSGTKSSQMAFCTETIEYVNLDANQSYFAGFTLAQFLRACTIAPNFRWYKPLSVTWTYHPIYNVFQNSGNTAVGAPYFYKTMNRTQDSHIYNKFDLQAMGAKPIRFTKPLSFTYKPNWCSSGLLVAGQYSNTSINTLAAQGLKPEWGWLQAPGPGAGANPSNVSPVPAFSDTQGVPGPIPPAAQASTSAQMLPIYAANTMFNGHDVFIQQDNASATQDVCRLTVTVKWAFKDPQNYTGVSQSLNIAQPKGTQTAVIESE